MLFLSFVCYRFKSSNLDTMCPISRGLCASASARFARRRRSKCKQQSTGSSLSLRLASTSQFFLLRPCQVVEVVSLLTFPLSTLKVSFEHLMQLQTNNSQEEIYMFVCFFFSFFFGFGLRSQKYQTK